MKEHITVFDIEVLNQDPASVCSIGIVELVDQQIVSTYYSLIKPRNLTFDPCRYKIHKIRPQSLYKEKNFRQVWSEIKHYFEDTIVVSHDIQGDMMNLRAALKQEHIPYPHLYMSCTNVLAHLIYPDIQKYNIKELSNMIGYSFEAHQAMGDALACAHVLVAMMKQQNADTLQQLHQYFHLDFGEMKENYYRNIISPESAHQLLDMVAREDALLYHQAVCFTGKLSMPKEVLAQKAKEVSALPMHSVSTQTNYLVIGDDGYKRVRFGRKNKKVMKALKLMKQGQDLHIIKEMDFLKLLEEKK